MQGPSGDFYESICEEDHLIHYFYIPNSLATITFGLEMDEQLTGLLIQAHRELGILEGMTKYCLPMQHFKDMIIRNEACHSCMMDGVTVTYDGMLKATKDDISNYTASNCYSAIKNIDGKPFTADLICNLHKIIMQSSKVEDIGGIFRKKSFLMHPDYSTNGREYNPPLPQFLHELIANLSEFIVENDTVDVLVKAALAYYQFETIHPFMHGNGRTGRLLPMMVLLQNGILSQPILPLSCYLFENNRQCSIEIKRVQFGGDYIAWIKFFIQGVLETSKKTISQLEKATQLRNENIHRINAFQGKAKLLLAIYEYVEQMPTISIKKISDDFQIAYNTAAKTIDILIEFGILVARNEKARYREFDYKSYIDIFNA